MLSDEVAGLLVGDAAEDAWEAAFHLLTVDPDGYPRVCLLSKAELAADGYVIRCVLRARRTIANVRRDGRAVLTAVGPQAAHYVRLQAQVIVEDSGSGGTGVRFMVTAEEADTLGIPLRPMTFRASAYVRDRERWDENRALLDRLAGDGRA